MNGYLRLSTDDHRSEAMAATRELLRTGVGAVTRMSRRRLRVAGTAGRPYVTGALTEGMYGMHATGVPTAELTGIARELLAALPADLCGRLLADVPFEQWLRWSRATGHQRTGIAVPDLGVAGRRSALDLIDAGLSPARLGDTAEVARLHRLATATLDRDGLDYGRVTVVGAPSPVAPWGWQVRGRHLTVSCFQLGDQVMVIPVSGHTAAMRTDARDLAAVA